MARRSLFASTIALATVAAAACSSGLGAQSTTTTTTTATGGAAGAGGSTAAAGPTLITTDKGPVQGMVEGTTRAFLGIPFAAPPTGALRWKPPQPRAAWTAPRNATQVGVYCPQLSELGSSPMDGTSEDCLTLNVWTPSAVAAGGRPVMVWIHGGGFTIDSGADPVFDGQSLSEATGAVIVTLNYRLGPLGFLALAALDAEDPSHPASGNYGFQDQRAALSWVKTNIAAFGGNAADVTLFGESAGGISTCLHLVSPPSQGLFQRAIIESGPCAIANNTKAFEEAQGQSFATALGCTDPTSVLACLRGKTPDEILVALPLKTGEISPSGVAWFPYADGVDLPDQPETLLEGGQFAKVPVLLGTNKNEGTLFFALGVSVTDESSFQTLMESLFPGQGTAIVGMYPIMSFASPQAAAAEAFGDGAFVCPTRRAARALTKGGTTAYLYQFTHAVTTGLFQGLGVYHSSEVPFIFENPYIGITLDAQELTLSAAMRGFWSTHAANGKPSAQGGVAWPVYDATSDTNMVLDLQLSTETGLKSAICDFWDGITP
jgi:para-nitrobenzyl esterase